MTQTTAKVIRLAQQCPHCHEPSDPKHFFCPVCSHDLHNPDAKMLPSNCCSHALYTTRRFDFCPTCKQLMNNDEGQII